MKKNHSSTSSKSLPMKELERKSLERKIQKTVANLKIVDRQLPHSFAKNNSCLVPNSVSTKTFKKGLTLHSLLCNTNPCEQQHSSKKSSPSTVWKKTQSHERISQRANIAFYRNLRSTLGSSSSEVEHFERSSFGCGGGEGIQPMNCIEKCANSTSHGKFGGSTIPMKKMPLNDNREAEKPKQNKSLAELCNDGNQNWTAGKAELNESSETLVDGLNQQLKELKETLTIANEKLGAVANQMDRTLNDSFLEMDQNEQCNGENEICVQNALPAKSQLKDKSAQTMDLWQISSSSRQCHMDRAVSNESFGLECKMRTDSRELMRKHIETLREHMKVRVFLLHAKRKGLPATEKKNGQREFRALMDEFDEAKRKIKADFKRGSVDKGVLAKHYVEIGQLQRETRLLQSELEHILNTKIALEAAHSPSEGILRQFQHLFKFVNMEKRTDPVETEQADLFPLESNPMALQMAAVSPQIPPLNFDRLSVNEISGGDEGEDGVTNRTFTLSEHVDEAHEEQENAIKVREEVNAKTSAEDLSSDHKSNGKINQHIGSDIGVMEEVVDGHAEGIESSKKFADRSVSFSELTSARGGDTSDDITSIPFPSEADNEANSKGRNGWIGENRSEKKGGLSGQDGGSTPTSSRRVKYKVRTEEWEEKIEVSAHGRQMGTEFVHCVVQQHRVDEKTEKGKSEPNECPQMGDRLTNGGEQNGHGATAEKDHSVELVDSVFEEQTQHASPANEIGINGGPSNGGKCSPTVEVVHGKRQREEEEEVEVISAKSLVRSSTLTQRTLAEVESIPEELSSVGRTDSQPNSAISAVGGKKTAVSTELSDEHTQQHQATDDSVTEEVFSDDIAFKPSEKSLHSILSMRSNSVSTTARDSMGKLRRDSASEALLKLRSMHCVPELSPRQSKSPPKPLRSPRSIERFMAKFPHNSSREASFSEEVSAGGEMLEELPNASQIGMLFDVSGASVEGTLSKLDNSASDSKRRQSDLFVCTEKRADSVESNKVDRGDSFVNVPEVCSAGVKARAEKTSHVQLDTNRILLAQFVYDHLNIWPTQQMLMEMDEEIIKGLGI